MKLFVLLLLWTLSAANSVFDLFDLSFALDYSGATMEPIPVTIPNIYEEVHAMRGDDALLFFSFPHLRLSNYSGLINIRWIAVDARQPPFFSCTLHSSSDEDISACSSPGLKYKLSGDPRQGALSLLINDVTLVDEEVYFCEVELEGQRGISNGTKLSVGVNPRILSLTELNRTRTGRLLECRVEGKPLPYISWSSQSQCELESVTDLRRSGSYWVTSYVQFHHDEKITCHAESPLGRVEQTYPGRSSLALIVRGSVFGVVLLLTMGLVACKLRRGYPLCSQHPSEDDLQDDPVYSIYYENRADVLQVLQSPAGGAEDPCHDFSTVEIHS